MKYFIILGSIVFCPQFIFVQHLGVHGKRFSFDKGDSSLSRQLHVDRRILGGVKANAYEGNYQASLRQLGIHYCGGAIISPTWIITAAHCVIGKNPPEISVMVGSKQLDGLDGKILSTAQMFSHEKFDSLLPKNDIGLLQTQELIIYTYKISPVQLPSENFDDMAVDDVVATGWGYMDHQLQRKPNDLQKIHLKIRPLEMCKMDFDFVNEFHICTLTRFSEGVCQGDSGGPLTYKNILIGIVSFGEPCAIGLADVYTRVKYFKPWIKNVIDHYPKLLTMPVWPFLTTT